MEDSLGSEKILSNVVNQYHATFIANSIVLGYGCTVGWLSPALPVLLSNNTPLSTGQLTTEDLSWIGSLSSFGSICGTFICGFLSMFFGTKRAMIFLAFPPIVFWLLVHFANTYQHILWARFITGLTGGGFQAGVALFVKEISNDGVRGRLGSLTPLARNTGLLIAFVVTAVIDYKYWPFIFIWIPVVYLFWLFTLPNTPMFYIRREQFNNAIKSLTYYKGYNDECDKQKALINAEFDRLKSIEDERRKQPNINVKDFCNRMAIKGIIISVIISWFLQSTGCYLITNYASIIFTLSGTVPSIEVSSIILAVMQILGGLISTQMADTFGRRTTLYISLSASAVGLLAFAVYAYFHHHGYDVANFMWLPVVCLSFIMFISSAGIMALSNTCAIENFPAKFRIAGTTWYSLVNNGVAFVGEKYFAILLKIIYLHGIFLFLSINCFIGLLFVRFMKEARGKPI